MSHPGASDPTLPSTLPRLPASEVPAAVPRPAPVLPGLSIVLPCFQEEANVADAIRAAESAAAATSEKYEILVVDDGSTDKTAEIAARFVDGSGRVRLLVHAHNRGYGAAVRSGIEAASMPWVLLTDADLQFDLRELEDFVMLTRSADLVAGRRVLRQDPLGRRLNGAAWSWLMRTLFDLPVRDVDCAFKLVRRDLLDGIALTSSGALISAELLIACQAQGAHIVEHGVRHRPRVAGEQSGARVGVVVRAFAELAGHYSTLRHLSRIPRAQP
jgi:glycosyltransferase involved in cell wall biosynthesis